MGDGDGGSVFWECEVTIIGRHVLILKTYGGHMEDVIAMILRVTLYLSDRKYQTMINED